MRLLVLGVGNPTFGDDSLGLYVSRKLKEKISGKKLKAKVDIEESSLDWLTIAEKMLGYDEVILIDTIIAKDEEQVGKIFKIDLKQIEEKHEYSYMIHNFGFSSAFKIVSSLSPEQIPKKIMVMLVGIKEPKEFSERLSPMIKRTANILAREILDEISK